MRYFTTCWGIGRACSPSLSHHLFTAPVGEFGLSCMMCYPTRASCRVSPAVWSYTHAPSLSDLETYHRERRRPERTGQWRFSISFFSTAMTIMELLHTHAHD